MKKIFFFMLFIFKFTFSSQVNDFKKVTKEDVVRKHLYFFIKQQPSTPPEQLQEFCFRAFSFDKKQEESFLFEADVYFLKSKLKEQDNMNDNGNNPVVKDYLIQLRSNKSKVTYNYLKKVKEAALSKKEIDKNFELKLRAFDLYKELKELNYL